MLEAAVQRHRAGDLDGAETLYREVLESAPGHADALHMWGLVAYQQGAHKDAIGRLERGASLVWH